MRHRTGLRAAAAATVCLVALVSTGSAGATAHHPLRPHIIGGQPVPAGTFPQLAYIVNQVGPDEYASCTGTLLSSNVVLTAAHCAANLTTGVADPASGFDVLTGQPNLTGSLVGHVSKVSNVIVYPLYAPVSRDGDAALLELTTPTTAPAIALATPADAAQWQPATEVAIAGWGLTDGADPSSQPPQVQWATTQIQPADVCEASASVFDVVFDPDNQICTIDSPAEATGTCHGDSGGPLLAQYSTGTPIEIGITVWGQAECDTTYPNFFTQIGPISGWAETWVNDLAPPPIPAPPPAPTPAPAPTPTPSRQTPRTGRYHGYSSQHHVVAFTVGSSATTVSSMTFGFRLRCSRGRHRFYTLRTRSFTIRNRHFGGHRRTGDGAGYKLAGRFSSTDAASGTIKTNRRGARYGNCQSGVIHWHADR